MKTVLLSIAATVAASAAFAGESIIAYTPTAPAASSNGAEGAVLLLLLVGAVVLMNGGVGANRAKAPAAEAENDDDVIMKF